MVSDIEKRSAIEYNVAETDDKRQRKRKQIRKDAEKRCPR
jgi:hypothetical protein